MSLFKRSTTQLLRFGHMTLPFQARDAYGVLRILCKHFGKFPGQTLPLRWLILEWRSGARLGTASLSDSVPTSEFADRELDQHTNQHTNQRLHEEADRPTSGPASVPMTEIHLHVAIEHAIHAGWLVRHTAGDEAVIELTKAGYQRYSEQEAMTALSKNMPRELLKLLKKKG